LLLPDTAEHIKDSTLLPHLKQHFYNSPARPPFNKHKRKSSPDVKHITSHGPQPPAQHLPHYFHTNASPNCKNNRFQLRNLTSNTDKTAVTALAMAGAQQTGLRKRTPPFPTKQMTILGEFCKFWGGDCFEAFANENQHSAESANRLLSCRFSHMYTS
jgi:hypothetical protein